VGSTPLSEELDPEDLREVISQYHAACEVVIERHRGVVAQHLGDGVLVYFGHPKADEDDARRAVSAGLELHHAVAQVTAAGRALAVRVGIHTGIVVVGAVGADRHQLALGTTPNLAARIQQESAPGTVTISDVSHGLVAGFFHSEDLGPRELRGISHPIRLYRVEAESGAQSRIEAAMATGLTPYVGRSQELLMLLSECAAVEDGGGCVFSIRGEAGIGKSRLIEQFKSRTNGRFEIAECRCTSYQQDTTLFPLVELLERQLDFRTAASPEEKSARLKASLARAGPDVAAAFPLVSGLLSLPISAPEHEPQLSPAKRRQLMLEALYQWVRKSTAALPLLFVVEDLHWADPTTLEFVGMLVERDPSPRLMALVTFRPELTPSWHPNAHVTELLLPPLQSNEVRALVNHVALGRKLPVEVMTQVVSRAGGIPLYCEELTKAVIETGVLFEKENRYELTGPLPSGLIPKSIQDSLVARLDRVGNVRYLAQLAATLGQEFTYDVLKAVSGQRDAELQSDLQNLLDAGLIYVNGRPPAAVYTFKHALIRDAAYESLLRSTRQTYHREIAETLEAQFSEIAERQPELMARHYEGASLADKAIECWERAIERDKSRAANKETIAHVGHALELVRAMPPSPERWHHELGLELSLGPALTAVRGWSSPEVRQTYTRAHHVCRELGKTRDLFPVLWGLWSYHLVSGDHKSSNTLAEEVYRFAQGSHDPELMVTGTHAMGYAHYFTARYSQTLEVARGGIGLYEPDRERSIFRRFQIASSAAIRDQAGTALWALGYPDQARTMAEQGLAVTTSLGNRTAAAFGASMLAWGVARLLRDTDRVRHLAEQVIQLSSEEENSFWPPLMMVFHGWARSDEGQPEIAIDEIRSGLREYRAMGGGVLVTSCFVHLAEALHACGRHEEGLDTVAEAEEFVSVSGEHHYEQELYRVKGELLVARAENQYRDGSGLSEAEASFQLGLDISRRQGARSFQLRAATSLGRLWHKHGKSRDASRMLADIYATFTEGFDTRDLRDARVLLDNLGVA
jgi:class 3 adenylate cyclase/predicted ATPase